MIFLLLYHIIIVSKQPYIAYLHTFLTYKCFKKILVIVCGKIIFLGYFSIIALITRTPVGF